VHVVDFPLPILADKRVRRLKNLAALQKKTHRQFRLDTVVFQSAKLPADSQSNRRDVSARCFNKAF